MAGIDADRRKLRELGETIDWLLSDGQLFAAVELNYQARALLARILREEGTWT